MKNITSNICKLSGCCKSDVLSKSRKPNIVRARFILIAYNRLVLLKTQEEAVKEFKTSHSMVRYSIKAIRNDFETNKNYREIFGEFLINNKIV